MVVFALKAAVTVLGPLMYTLQTTPSALTLVHPFQPSKVCVALFQLARAFAVVRAA